MPNIRLFFFAALLILAMPLTAARLLAADLSTPEGAIAAYIEGVADRDFSAILAATSAENMSKGVDFAVLVERLRLLTPRMPSPSTDDFFIEINKTDFTGQIVGQVKFLAYGLMTTNDILEGKSVQMDAAGADDFASVVRADRLSGLELVKVGIPSPRTVNSERYQLNATKIAKVYGADASTERVALISFEGLNFAIGFQLLQYGDEWSIMGQSSPISGLSPVGVPKRVSPEEFENMVK